MIICEAAIITWVMIVEPGLLHVIVDVEVASLVVVKGTKVLVPCHVHISSVNLRIISAVYSLCFADCDNIVISSLIEDAIGVAV